MPNAAVAGLIAQRLPEGLLHPGDPNANQPAKLIPLPGLRSTGIPPEMAKQFAAQAGLPSHDVPKLIGEAIVYLLETEGFAIIPSTELEQLRTQAADAPDGTRIISVHCRCDTTRSKPLIHLTVDKTDQVITDGKALLQGLAKRGADCPHETR